MKRMLFNATQAEELRVAIVDGQRLLDIDIEQAGRELKKGNIYKGIVSRIEPSLEACFVDYGEERHGFLSLKEISKQYFKSNIEIARAKIQDVIAEGQELLVQVEKEERGNKGAALTTFISLAGRYVVLMPNDPRGGGVSRRVEGGDRQDLRDSLEKLDYPKGMSIIVRTAGLGRESDDLQWDLNYLLKLWQAISEASNRPGAYLIYQESSLVIRAIRDYFSSDISEILIDVDDIFEQSKQFMSYVMPDMAHKVKRYSDSLPLFSRFQIEQQIETAYSRTVNLPSGGAIVIDHTEALVSIDVNSARATRGADIEDTAFRTNMEAVEEVCRQMRLRDLGGLIVVDFIDMENANNQRLVENKLRDALRGDRARVQIGKISRFGLMEISRQRLRPSLAEGMHITCPRCNGTGHIRDIESNALQLLRIIQEESMKELTAAIHAQVPVSVAAFLLNEKRVEITKIELKQHISIVIIPNEHLETPNYKVERIKHEDPRLESNALSFTLAEQLEEAVKISKRDRSQLIRADAVVKGITPDVRQETPPPSSPPPDSQQVETPNTSHIGFLEWIKQLWTPVVTKQVVIPPSTSEQPPRQSSTQRGRVQQATSNPSQNGKDTQRDKRFNKNRLDQHGDASQSQQASVEARNAGRALRSENAPNAEVPSPKRRTDKQTIEKSQDDVGSQRKTAKPLSRSGTKRPDNRVKEESRNPNPRNKENSTSAVTQQLDQVQGLGLLDAKQLTGAQKSSNAASEEPLQFSLNPRELNDAPPKIQFSLGKETEQNANVKTTEHTKPPLMLHLGDDEPPAKPAAQMTTPAPKATQKPPQSPLPQTDPKPAAVVKAQTTTFAFELDTLNQMTQEANLQWVQSKAPASVPISTPSQPLGRNRKPHLSASVEPLVMIETQQSVHEEITENVR